MSAAALRPLAGLAAGLVFGLGLVISGMADPAKVLAFLDIAGAWDPSLAFVMGGAIAVALPGFLLLPRRGAPALGGRFELPTARAIDRNLLLGAALFGLGWGIGGFCPGPAFTALTLAAPGTLVFVPAMLAGMWLGHRLRGGRLAGPAAPAR
ncbi:YeeE/YedE family protein [Paralimibaculum aggregatum]|uniref:YeeE/YedE family protein n=1 Tax=Paralimibaculum aggregatum TaxID=3036245 RepID=A0ABQ6LQG9_9RHOB|nr:DUF6691 family protein [Limibaculum sp. NKW23]GMG84217.1 YeeE/YedE family protein [Limibaculum sp. NKW23]